MKVLWTGKKKKRKQRTKGEKDSVGLVVKVRNNIIEDVMDFMGDVK
jgi:hypothetical protein